MGFDLYWADLYEADDPDADDPEAVGGYFRTTQAMMASLVAEMDAQGMFDDNEQMKEKLSWNSDDVVTVEEIRKALERGGLLPREPQPPVVATKFDQDMYAASLEHGFEIEGGPEAMMEIHPLRWAKAWIDWVVFLAEARDLGGGFRVT